MSDNMFANLKIKHAINVDNTKIRRNEKWNTILNTTADSKNIHNLIDNFGTLLPTLDSEFFKEIIKILVNEKYYVNTTVGNRLNLTPDQIGELNEIRLNETRLTQPKLDGKIDIFFSAIVKEKLESGNIIHDINELIEKRRLVMFRFLIVKYICETRKYTSLAKSGEITVNTEEINEIKKLLESKKQLQDEIITYISMDKKFTEKQIDDLKNKNTISDKDGTYTNYNSLFYIKIENDLETISINYLNAEKHCNSSLTGPDFFVNHTAFYETIKKIFEYEDEAYKTYLNFNTFDITKNVFKTNKEDKIGKGIKRFLTDACGQLMDEITKKNYNLVIKTINGDDTESDVDDTESDVDDTESKVGVDTPPEVGVDTPPEVDDTPSHVGDTPSHVDYTPSDVDDTPMEVGVDIPDPNESPTYESNVGGARRKRKRKTVKHKRKTVKRRNRKRKTLKKKKRTRRL